VSLLSGHQVLVVDTETTGFDPAAHELLEVATVSVREGALGDLWSTLLRPERPIPPDASAVHGISDAMVAAAPARDQVAAELRRRCDRVPLVFHHAAFDLPFLAALLRRAGQPPLYNPVVDTLGLARGLSGTGGSRTLGALAEHLGLPPEPQHRALGDACTTARLFVALSARWEQERGIRTLDELAAASQDALRQTTTR
jgi:DNA polymerase III epsilon subunit family exonuclease